MTGLNGVLRCKIANMFKMHKVQRKRGGFDAKNTASANFVKNFVR